MLNERFTTLQDLFLSWSSIHCLGELLIPMFWRIVSKMLLLLKECVWTTNVIEISHFMVIYVVVIWRKAPRYVLSTIWVWILPSEISKYSKVYWNWKWKPVFYYHFGVVLSCFSYRFNYQSHLEKLCCLWLTYFCPVSSTTFLYFFQWEHGSSCCRK